MKYVLAINASPRQKENTATLLKEALKGCAEMGASTELVHLYSLQFKGCLSCFACKRKNRKHGSCAMHDDLSPLLEKIKTVDALILGTPIYFGNFSSSMLAFLERLLFSNYLYSASIPTVFPKKLPHAYIVTMNATEEQAKQFHYDEHCSMYQKASERILQAEPLLLNAYDTYQFTDYSNYESSIFNPVHKAEVRAKLFPRQCQEAYELGQKLLGEAARLTP